MYKILVTTSLKDSGVNVTVIEFDQKQEARNATLKINNFSHGDHHSLNTVKQTALALFE